MGRLWGLNGIIGATIITNLTVNLWIEPLIIHHYGLMRSSIWFYITSLARVMIIISIGYLTMFINSFIPLNGILLILARTMVCLLIIAPVFFLLYRKNDEAKVILSTLKIAFKKEKHKDEKDNQAE